MSGNPQAMGVNQALAAARYVYDIDSASPVGSGGLPFTAPTGKQPKKILLAGVGTTGAVTLSMIGLDGNAGESTVSIPLAIGVWHDMIYTSITALGSGITAYVGY